jgi:hypothetical protein
MSPIKSLLKNVANWVPAIHVAPYTPKVALIVEPRQHIHLAPVIVQMAGMYPEWLIYLYHGTANGAFVRTHPDLEPLIDSGALVLFPLAVANLTSRMYNAMFISPIFWETVNAQHALVFQTDVWICEQPSSDINDFLKYDFVGSPRNLPMLPKLFSFMNGGFSLRNVEAMKRVIQHCPFPDPFGVLGEDVYFSRPCKAAQLHMPSLETASGFGIQQRHFDNPDVVPIGTHKPWEYKFGFKNDGLNNLLDRCGNVPDTFAPK